MIQCNLRRCITRLRVRKRKEAKEKIWKNRKKILLRRKFKKLAAEYRAKMNPAITRIQKFYKIRYNFFKLRFVVDKAIERKKLEKEQAEIVRLTEEEREKTKNKLTSGVDDLY